MANKPLNTSGDEPIFVLRYSHVEIDVSARKHGIPDGDISHAAKHAILTFQLKDDDFWRELVVGPDRAGNVLEIVVLEYSDGRRWAIHAMKMTKKYEKKLLERLGGDDAS